PRPRGRVHWPYHSGYLLSSKACASAAVKTRAASAINPAGTRGVMTHPLGEGQTAHVAFPSLMLATLIFAGAPPRPHRPHRATHATTTCIHHETYHSVAAVATAWDGG